MSETEAEKDGEIRFRASSSLWKYLGWLTKHSVLGKTENEVAKQVLVQRLSTMRKEDFRDHQGT